MKKYLVYDRVVNMHVPICICKTAADAEEMCLTLAWEDYYNRYYIAYHYFKTLPYELGRISLINSSNYNYMEVPCVG